MNSEFDLLFPKIKMQEFYSLPLPKEVLFPKISSTVIKILKFKKLETEIDIAILESQINQLVYEFYGLTEEEIRIVEGK